MTEVALADLSELSGGDGSVPLRVGAVVELDKETQQLQSGGERGDAVGGILAECVVETREEVVE